LSSHDSTWEASLLEEGHPVGQGWSWCLRPASTKGRVAQGKEIIDQSVSEVNSSSLGAGVRPIPAVWRPSEVSIP
jgi:hypothetical protein